MLRFPEPYDFALSTERFRTFGVDLANLWHEGGLHRVVGSREVRIEAASWVEPPLTTIEQPIDQIASTAVDLLQTVIEEPNRSLPRVLLQPRLRPGRSTAHAAV